MSHVSCPTPPVCATDLIDKDFADLAVLWRKLVDLGNLAVLVLLADLADWKPFFCGHEI